MNPATTHTEVAGANCSASSSNDSIRATILTPVELMLHNDSSSAVTALLEMHSSPPQTKRENPFESEQAAKMMREAVPDPAPVVTLSPRTSLPMAMELGCCGSPAMSVGSPSLAASMPDVHLTPDTVNLLAGALDGQQQRLSAAAPAPGFSPRDRWSSNVGVTSFVAGMQQHTRSPPSTGPQPMSLSAMSSNAFGETDRMAGRWQAMLRASLQVGGVDALTLSLLAPLVSCSAVDVPVLLDRLAPQQVQLLNADARDLVQQFVRYLAAKRGERAAVPFRAAAPAGAAVLSQFESSQRVLDAQRCNKVWASSSHHNAGHLRSVGRPQGVGPAPAPAPAAPPISLNADRHDAKDLVMANSAFGMPPQPPPLQPSPRLSQHQQSQAQSQAQLQQLQSQHQQQFQQQQQTQLRQYQQHAQLQLQSEKQQQQQQHDNWAYPPVYAQRLAELRARWA